MDGVEAGSSVGSVGQRPLHAFSLPTPGEARLPGRPYARGWRPAFGGSWSELAVGPGIEGHVDPTRLGVNARRSFELVHRDLLTLWETPRAGRASPLHCAAAALEANAQVWRAFGPAAGHRHLHLRHRMEERLAATEREILAAEQSLFASRPAVSSAARSACAAIDDLLSADRDRAQALAALEDAAVDLAALAVRIARNLDEVGGARRRSPERPATLMRHLSALATEVIATAHAACTANGSDEAENHVGVWLSAALRIAPMSGVIELARGKDGDPCLRSDALLSLRSCWLRLAVALWMIVQELDLLLAIATFRDDAHLEGAVISRAQSALLSADLCRRPASFDHEQAWNRHREALSDLVSDACRSLQTYEPDVVVRSQQLALRRLARVLAAMWVIDERLRSPAQHTQLCP
jgi:hypothetical protein